MMKSLLSCATMIALAFFMSSIFASNTAHLSKTGSRTVPNRTMTSGRGLEGIIDLRYDSPDIIVYGKGYEPDMFSRSPIIIPPAKLKGDFNNDGYDDLVFGLHENAFIFFGPIRRSVIDLTVESKSDLTKALKCDILPQNQIFRFQIVRNRESGACDERRA